VDEILEHGLTRRLADAKQTRRLVHVQREPGHFAVLADDLRHDVPARWSSIGSASTIPSPFWSPKLFWHGIFDGATYAPERVVLRT